MALIFDNLQRGVMMENTREYFCWLRAVDVPAPAGDEQALDEAIRFQVPANVTMTPAEAEAHLRRTCPTVTYCIQPFSKDAPAPPVRAAKVGKLEQRTRMILSEEYRTAVHLEKPRAAFDMSIEMWPVFGSRMDALLWIESPAGQNFSAGAKALSLICFAALRGK